MSSVALKKKRSAKASSELLPADRIWTPRYKLSNGVTQAELKKVINTVISERLKRERGA